MDQLTSALPAHLTERIDHPKAKNTMGKDEFMKLLLTQLQHQDPLNPLDHKEFSAQLAQFSSLEQLSNIGSGIQNLRSDKGEDSKLQALSLIGKNVQATGNDVQLLEGQSASLNLKLPAGSAVQPVKLSIFGGDGALVREMDLGNHNVQNGVVAWDGRSNDGLPMPTGKYHFRVFGMDGVGQTQEVVTETSGKVVGVEMAGKTPVLVVETGTGRTRLELAKISNVSLDEGKPETKLAPNAKSLMSPSAIPGMMPPGMASAAGLAKPEEGSAFPAESNFRTHGVGGIR